MFKDHVSLITCLVFFLAYQYFTSRNSGREQAFRFMLSTVIKHYITQLGHVWELIQQSHGLALCFISSVINKRYFSPFPSSLLNPFILLIGLELSTHKIFGQSDLFQLSMNVWVGPNSWPSQETSALISNFFLLKIQFHYLISWKYQTFVHRAAMKMK